MCILMQQIVHGGSFSYDGHFGEKARNLKVLNSLPPLPPYRRGGINPPSGVLGLAAPRGIFARSRKIQNLSKRTTRGVAQPKLALPARLARNI